MAFLNEAVNEAVRVIVGRPEDESEVYHSSNWVGLRARYAELKGWYDGDEWTRVMPDVSDPVTGKLALQWPLQVNMISKICRIHRAVMLGMQPDVMDTPPVTTLVSRKGLDEAQRQQADTLQNFVGSVWWKSNAHSILFEAGLLEQVYGGHVFRVNWEPFNTALPYRMAVRSFKNPGWFYASATDPVNSWDLLDAYVGYLISKDVAKAKYGINAEDDKVLYLEHWTKEVWRVTVDGRVPTMRQDDMEYELQGENKWGVIPLVYIPHERDGDFHGRSIVDGDSTLIGLSKELNARLADKGESLQNAQSILYVKNTRTQGMAVRQLDVGGRTLDIVDIGDAGRMPNSPEPEAGVLEPRGIPQAVADFTGEVLDYMRHHGDVAEVAFGDDDVSGGRITGPVTAYRMWPTMQHTASERSFFSDGMNQIARIILAMALERQKAGEFERYGALSPGLDDSMQLLDFATSWRPMIPMEELQKSQILDNQLRAGGISLVTYLRERGVQDPEAEAQRIWEERAQEAEMTAQARAKAFENVSRVGQEEDDGETERDETG
jgi:hypothetical protein